MYFCSSFLEWNKTVDEQKAMFSKWCFLFWILLMFCRQRFWYFVPPLSPYLQISHPLVEINAPFPITSSLYTELSDLLRSGETLCSSQWKFREIECKMGSLYTWKQSLILFYSSLRCGERNFSKFKIAFLTFFEKFIWTSIKKELLKCKASKGKWVCFTGTCM